jgi:hypothetical protein
MKNTKARSYFGTTTTFLRHESFKLLPSRYHKTQFPTYFTAFSNQSRAENDYQALIPLQLRYKKYSIHYLNSNLYWKTRMEKLILSSARIYLFRLESRIIQKKRKVEILRIIHLILMFPRMFYSLIT